MKKYWWLIILILVGIIYFFTRSAIAPGKPENSFMGPNGQPNVTGPNTPPPNN
jgi:hypothetical protein